MKVLAFAGYSGAGKTTLLEQVIGGLRQHGLRVSVVKHARHGFDMDHPGKDTQRHREAGAFEVVVPSRTILAEPSVALVDRNVDKHGTRTLATAYLNYLYSPRGQQIAAQNYYRPRNAQIAAQYASQFLPVKTFTIKDVAGGWSSAQNTHFDNGGIFDQIYQAK